MTTEAYVNVVMAEGIAAGLLETCCSFRLSDLGRSVCLPRACMRANPPARACVEVSRLPKGALIEIEAMACE